MLGTEEKLFIRNRLDERMCVVVQKHATPRGVALVLHGLAATKDQKMIVVAAHTLHKNGYTVVRFDATNTFGESDGDIERATLTKHFEDLVDVLLWLKVQTWCTSSLTLVGHSMGGYAIARYAELNPQDIERIIPISPVVSGLLTLEAHIEHDPTYIQNWKETGWREDQSVSSPGRMKRIPWSHMEDRLEHSLLPDAGRLTMPVTIIVGADDPVTTVPHMQLLLEAIAHQKKQLIVVPQCAHVFRSDEQCAALAQALRAAIIQ